MLIQDLLAEKSDTDVKVIGEGNTIGETAERLLARNIGALVVVNEFGRLSGIVSERDLIRAIVDCPNSLVDETIGGVMTRSVITCAPSDDVGDVCRLMQQNAIRHIPVLEAEDLVGIISIRELTRANEGREEEVLTDPLTGLPNRRQFTRTLDSELDRYRRYGREFSLALIDLNAFEAVNETYGHEAGDRLLRYLASLLVFELRTSDLIGRLNGEEIAIIFPEANLEQADLACKRLLSKIEQATVDVGNSNIPFTVSIGVTAPHSDTFESAAIIGAADELMQTAKASGKNNIQVEDRSDLDAGWSEGEVVLHPAAETSPGGA